LPGSPPQSTLGHSSNHPDEWEKQIGVPRPMLATPRSRSMSTVQASPSAGASRKPPMPHPHLFTSESVSMGHPDKVADQISDAILDAMIADDPFSRVACETMCCTGLVVVAGEVTTNTYVNIPELVR